MYVIVKYHSNIFLNLFHFVIFNDKKKHPIIKIIPITLFLLLNFLTPEVPLFSGLPQKIYPYIKKNLENMAETKVRIIMENIKTITNYNPSFVAVGKSGFSGYMIYGFNNKEKVILESIELNKNSHVFVKY